MSLLSFKFSFVVTHKYFECLLKRMLEVWGLKGSKKYQIEMLTHPDLHRKNLSGSPE